MVRAMLRALTAVAVAAIVLTGTAWAVGGERPVTSASCATDEGWAREQLNAILAGERRKPYGPYDGKRVVQAFRRAGFPLPKQNGLFTLYEVGLDFPDLCDFRWFAESNVFGEAITAQGQLKVFVVATPANAVYEYGERVRLSKKYRYAHAVSVLRKGNVVVEYFFKFPDGSVARRNRLADVRRVLARL